MTPRRKKVALAIAALADAVQLGFFPVFVAGGLAAPDDVLDFVVAVALVITGDELWKGPRIDRAFKHRKPSPRPRVICQFGRARCAAVMPLGRTTRAAHRSRCHRPHPTHGGREPAVGSRTHSRRTLEARHPHREANGPKVYARCAACCSAQRTALADIPAKPHGVGLRFPAGLRHLVSSRLRVLHRRCERQSFCPSHTFSESSLNTHWGTSTRRDLTKGSASGFPSPMTRPCEVRRLGHRDPRARRASS
jgi:hypothetical protein